MLREPPPAVLVDDGDLVVAHAVDMEFLQALDGVVDQELADTIVPVGEDEPADPAVIGEIEAPVVVPMRLPVEKVDALVVEPAPGVVEDQVEHHRQAFHV